MKVSFLILFIVNNFLMCQKNIYIYKTKPEICISYIEENILTNIITLYNKSNPRQTLKLNYHYYNNFNEMFKSFEKASKNDTT